jgi:hypothetical protein
MNERIKELLEQVGLKHHNWITNESNVKDGDFKYPRLEDYEKFAELIVQECVAICRDIDGEDNIDAKSGRQDCAVEIKEHFGVEE